jgi:hypothetical protein
VRLLRASRCALPRGAEKTFRVPSLLLVNEATFRRNDRAPFPGLFTDTPGAISG